MTQNRIRRYDALLISYSIHISLALTLAGVLWVSKNSPITTPEKTKIKILLDSPMSEHPTPSEPIVHTVPKETIPDPIPTLTPKTPIIPLEAPKPIERAIPAPSTPQSPAVSKAIEAPQIAVPKAPPPPPPPPPKPVKKEYTYPNKSSIYSILEKGKIYPKNAKRLNQQGDVTLSFTLSPEGEASAIVITQSSGFELLDNAARELIIKNAALFPRPEESVKITVPIGYTLH